MATYYLDVEGGNDANSGASFAQRVKTFARASALLVAGDALRVMASPGAVAMSKNIAWTKHSWKCELSEAVNANISNCDAAWTASANVTATVVTTQRKEGTGSASIAVASGFTTGLAAYLAMGSTNFSGYQQISLWIMQTAGNVAAANDISIVLCSDAAGATPVDTLNLPAINALNVWHPVVINKGSALGNAIQSVALYVNTDNGAQTFLLDNIVAVQAAGSQDELHHKMLVGKQSSFGAGGADSQMWLPIRAINGTTITFDGNLWASGLGSSDTREWPVSVNTTETVTGYTFQPSYVDAGVSIADVTLAASGLVSSRLTISGGWDRVAMSSQTGYSMIVQPPQSSNVGIASYVNWSDVSRIGVLRWGTFTHISESGTINRMFISCNAFTLRLPHGTGTKIQVHNVGVSIGGTDADVTLLYSSVPESPYSNQLLVNNGATATLEDDSLVYGLVPTAGQGLITWNGSNYGGVDLTGGGGGLDAAGVRAAVGLASANLDTQLANVANLPDDPADNSQILDAISSITVGGGTGSQVHQGLTWQS